MNGKRIFVDRIDSLARNGAGEWKGTAHGYPFEIFGGKASGGAANQWFVSWEAIGSGIIHVSSMVEAIDVIENS